MSHLPDDPEAWHRALAEWYDVTARDLPWRAPEASPWAVLVSELMLQQTPVVRVLPVYDAWLARWPTPADLAQAPSGEAVRAWGRLGYPRRALRLHAAAVAITERHGGEVPADHTALLALPGVGDYTAAAVASFAFGQTHPVLDTNVRRVLTRLVAGREHPPASTTRAERDVATALLPDETSEVAAPLWSVALMELGALVCTAREARCGVCPLADACAWRRAGHPAHDGPPRRGQPWAGTDRQVRGRLMAVLRDAEGSVSSARLARTWEEPVQRARALDGLLADGLVVRTAEGRYALPS